MKGWRWVGFVGCLVLCCLVIHLPAWAQEEVNLPSTTISSRPTALVIGGIPVLELQGVDYPSEVRVSNVSFVIAQFFRSGEDSDIPIPEVRVLQDSNRQFTLVLGEANRFEATQRYLFTVTYADAAAAKGIAMEEATLSQVQQVASQWAVDLERALRDYRQDQLIADWGSQPINAFFSVVIVLVVLSSVIPLWRGLGLLTRRGQAWLAHHWDSAGKHWLELASLTTLLGLRLALVAGVSHLTLSAIPIFRPLQRQIYFRMGQALSSTVRLLTQPLPNSSLSISSLLFFALMAIMVYVMAHRLSITIKQRFFSQFLDLGMQETASILIKYVFTLVGVLVILPFSGVDLSSLAVFAGAIGLGIGLGLQNLANNFLSYVGVLLERPIQIGDFIEVDNLLGSVDRISWRSTTIRTLDQVFVIVPNSRFMESKVVNWSYRQRQCRIHVPVGVDYRSDPNLVRQALLKVATDHPQVLETPAPQVWLKSFDDSALSFELLVWIDNPPDQFRLKSDLNYAIVAEFKRRKIEIPFPQRDLHIRTVNGLGQLTRLFSQPPEGTGPEAPAESH